MKLKIAQVVGLNTDQKAAQVVWQERDGETFLAVLDLTCDDAFTKGRQFLSEIADFYFEHQGKPSERLNAAFSASQQKLSREGEHQVLLGSVSGKVLYIIAKGNLACYLKRAGRLSELLAIGSPEQLISGFLNEGDRIFISTKSLTDFLGDRLERTLSLPSESFEEEISSQIGASAQENQGLAGLVMDVLEEEKIEVPGIFEEKVVPKAPEGYQATGKENLIAQLLASVVAFIRNSSSYLPKSGRGRLILAVVILAVVAIGAIFQYQQIQQRQKQQEFIKVFSSAKDEYVSAKGLASLNPTEAKAKLESAKNNLAKALSLNPKSEEALILQKQIEEESPSILKQFRASDFPLFLDLDLVKKDFKAQKMSLSAGKLLLLDPGSRTLILIDTGKKSQQILAGEPQLGVAELTSLNGNLAFSFSSDKGVLRTDVSDKKQTVVSKKDEDWGKILDISGFASNVYLLDTLKNQIWKYIPTASGYSDKQEYLKKGVTADFSGSLRMQIESSIYVLKSDGEVLRFTRGAKDNFSYEGLDKGVKDPKSFFVSSETDDLYVLDSGNLRLLILSKTGSYKGQISGDKFAQASDLVVDEKGKKVYLLEGDKIYTVDLK